MVRRGNVVEDDDHQEDVEKPEEVEEEEAEVGEEAAAALLLHHHHTLSGISNSQSPAIVSPQADHAKKEAYAAGVLVGLRLLSCTSTESERN